MTGRQVQVLLGVICITRLSWCQATKFGETFTESAIHERVDSGRVATVDLNSGQPTDWVPFGRSFGRSIWSMAFDSMSFDLDSNSPYSGVYGQTRGFFRFSNTYKNDLFAIDIQAMAPGSSGLSATRFITDIVWNPGGTYERSGSGRLAMAVFCARQFGTADIARSSYVPFGVPIPSAATNGIIIDFGVQAHGWRTYDVDLSSTGLSIPLPAVVSRSSPAALVVFIGTIDANGQFKTCPQGWAMQPTLDTMAAPNDPNYPGINPSESGPLQWDDDGGSLIASAPNGFHDNLTSTSNAFVELYSYDWSGSNGGYIQAAAGLFYKSSGNRLSGTVQNSPVPAALEVTIYATNASGQVLASPSGGPATRSSFVAVRPDGTFSITDPQIPVAGGGVATFGRISYGGSNGVIRVNSGPVSIAGSPVLPPVMLPTGDVDSSGEVDATDIDAVIAKFGSVFGQANWDSSRDVDSSGEVDAVDIDYVIASFGAVNQPPPNFP